MHKEDHSINRIIIGYIAAIIILAAACFVISWACSNAAGRVGAESGAAGSLNNVIAGEQQRTLDRTLDSIATVERIRSITADANTALAELRNVNRRSSDVLAELRAEIDIMEDYIRRIDGLVSGHGDMGGSEVNE